MSSTPQEPSPPPAPGLLIVGLGGYNGTVLLAGLMAHRHSLKWEGPHGEPRSGEGEMLGCVTQVGGRGTGWRGVKDLGDFAEAKDIKVGGWDLR